jgi:hypothetical protein
VPCNLCSDESRDLGYILGAFCGFLDLTEMEILHAHNAGDLDKSSIVFQLMTLKALSERVNP